MRLRVFAGGAALTADRSLPGRVAFTNVHPPERPWAETENDRALNNLDVGMSAKQANCSHRNKPI